MSTRLIRYLRRLYHYLAYVAGGMVIVVCIVALVFKVWVMPNISTYAGMLEDAAGKALGQPVRIGNLAADWSGINPRVILRDVRMSPPSGMPLVLPRVDAVFSWFSLALLDVRLASLTLDQPHLFMNRDVAGIITVAGIPVNVPGPPSPFPDWLLSQPHVVIKDADIIWLDEKLDAPELRFTGVRLLLESGFGRHRFGGIAYPTAAAARRFELRGDLKGGSLREWRDWSGEVYARVDDARFESWGRWVPWAQESVKRGVGDMRFWLTLNRGAVVGLSGDVRLDMVAINIDKALPDLLFERLTGHAGWAREKEVQSFFVDHLRFKLPGAAPSDPAAVRVNLTPDGRGGFKRIGVSASNLRLEALTVLTGALPIPKRGHDLIQALNPRGLVQEGGGHWSGADDYAIKLRIEAAGVNAYEQFPGIGGLTASVEASQRGGTAKVDGKGLNLTLSNIFRHDLNFSQLDAEVGWKLDDAGLKLDVTVDRMLNPDLDGTVQGHLEFPRSGPIQADINGHLRRGEANAVYRYLPLGVGDETYHWLRHSLLSGKSDDVRLVLKGPLDRFPFDKGGGEFKVAIRMVNGMLDYADGWPRIEGVHGMLVFHDKAMTLNADSGRILDARLGPVRVSIPDLHASVEEALIIDGQAFGETRSFLEFIRRSPVNEHTGRFTEPFRTVGDGRLNLHLHIPLRNLDATTLRGNFTFDNNRLDPGGDLPELGAVSGNLQFTQAALQARDIRARVLGFPVTLAIDSAQPAASVQEAAAHEALPRAGQVRVRLEGDIDAAALKPHLPAALLARISGSTRWQADVGMNAGGKSGLTFRSDLVGLAVNLPAPLGKTADQAMPLRVVRESTAMPAGEVDAVSARYGELLKLRAELPRTGQARVNLRVGTGEASLPTDAGLWISGNMRLLDLDAWRLLDLEAMSGRDSKAQPVLESSKPALREASIVFNELRLLNRRLRDTHIKLRPAGAGWRIAIAGRDITGELVTIPAGKGISVLANFKRLTLPEELPGKKPELESSSEDSFISGLAGLELSADSAALFGRELGELHLRLTPDHGGLRLENFFLKTPEGHLHGKGLVANHPRRPSRIEFELESGNLGKLLERLGMPGRMKQGTARITGPLGWTGGVEDFNFATLEGDLGVSLKQGQFIKLDPGAGKLLGILSLQALPRRISLDFRDVFTEGFAFDEIVGNLHIERGSVYARNLRMNGPAAKVGMSGVADLARETQNLRVTIQPRLEDTVAVAGALLGGPVVGVGTFLANKILQNPIGQVATFEYTITGPWAEPVVVKLARPKASAGE